MRSEKPASQNPSAAKEVELNECIDQLLETGGWEVGLPPGKARGELDSLMHVAALLLSLRRLITHPRPDQKGRMWSSVSNLRRTRRSTHRGHRGSFGGSCGRPRFGAI